MMRVLLALGSLLWIAWPVLNAALGQPALGRALLALIILVLLAGLVLFARQQRSNRGAVGALIAVAGLTVLLAGATVQFWLLPNEQASPGLRTIVGLADLGGMLALYAGGILIGLDLRRGSAEARRTGSMLILALPTAIFLLFVVAIAGVPFGDGIALHWPIGGALAFLAFTD
ncbi:MAG: hypothetical protein U0556_01445 [Dehalococcoidia bacterium]